MRKGAHRIEGMKLIILTVVAALGYIDSIYQADPACRGGF